MIHLYVTLQLLGHDLRTTAAKTRTAMKDDRGSFTLEQVILTVGLFLLAVAVIAAIRLAVMSRVGQIK